MYSDWWNYFPNLVHLVHERNVVLLSISILLIGTFIDLTSRGIHSSVHLSVYWFVNKMRMKFEDVKGWAAPTGNTNAREVFGSPVKSRATLYPVGRTTYKRRCNPKTHSALCQHTATVEMCISSAFVELGPLGHL